jgi:hypothetical protein
LRLWAGYGISCQEYPVRPKALDVYPRFWQGARYDTATPDQFRHAFGLCEPVPVKKRFLINNLTLSSASLMASWKDLANIQPARFHFSD